jgi:hypothetical protein
MNSSRFSPGTRGFSGGSPTSLVDSNGTMDIDLDKLRQHPMKVTDLDRFIPGGNLSLATVLLAASNIGSYDPKDPILRAEKKKLRAFGTEAARATQQENADKRNAPLVEMSERDDDIGSMAVALGISKDAVRKRLERMRRKGKISAHPHEPDALTERPRTSVRTPPKKRTL